LLEDETFPLSTFYKVVVTQLLLVCEWQSIFHVDPYDAHYTIISIVAQRFLQKYFDRSIYREAINLVTLHLWESWGARITFGGFKNVLMEVLEMI
jgi:glucose-6-phosphate 1-dehydrogenase